MAELYIHYGEHPREMTKALLAEADIASRLNAAMRVVIKPNLVVARPAAEGATTHPEVVEGILQYLRENGVKNIAIAEGSWVGDSTRRAFPVCGYTDLVKEYGAELIDTKGDETVTVSSQGQRLTLCRSVVEADYLINVPVLKGHCQTKMTCCLKNLKGCIPDGEKRRFHTAGLHQPIAALAAALRPHLHIVDSICGDLSFEEGGNPVESGRVLLGFDPVLVDSYGAGLMGYRPEEIHHLRLARDYGVGRFVGGDTVIRELGWDTRPKVRGTGLRRDISRQVEEDGACSACYAALAFALNRVKGPQGERVKIGQGFRGKACGGIGVGDCASGCHRHVGGCPPKGVDIVEFLETL